ncbi:MAG: antitoxin (DNA-binding transcriptional repressor) of toxin-antitoxin stability system [Phenylobacterium sp.]|jgi:antitoxin (DNA-binding transcriptional repressor) of toxin-antitoxin stability system
MSTYTVDINEAQNNLLRLIELVTNGEKVVIAQKNLPEVQLVVCDKPQTKRIAGLHKGKVHLSEDFNDSLDEKLWLGES